MCGHGFVVHDRETLQALLLHLFLNQEIFLVTSTPLIIRIITRFMNASLIFLLNMSIMNVSS